MPNIFVPTLCPRCGQSVPIDCSHPDQRHWFLLPHRSETSPYLCALSGAKAAYIADIENISQWETFRD